MLPMPISPTSLPRHYLLLSSPLRPPSSYVRPPPLPLLQPSRTPPRLSPPEKMRRIIYGISLWAFLLAAALTISSIALPNWITYTAPTSDRALRGLSGRGSRVLLHVAEYGLPDEFRCRGRVGVFGCLCHGSRWRQDE
ncbi:hypothetical protein KC362_g49 [Hortaea werneckii]|nr:hypothetical protein KC362_g49 [Hortaea werneckii]